MTITSPRSDAKSYVPPSPNNPDAEDHRRKLALAIADLMKGKLNVTKDVTLTANAASTTVMDSRIGATTVLVLVPTTANAAAALATTYQTYPNATANLAVLTHANNAQTDKTFVAVLIG